MAAIRSGPLAAGGYVFATTSGDEQRGFGSLVELMPPANESAHWQERTDFVFTNDADSSSPIGTLLSQGGTLYGTTYGAGSGPAPDGTIFAYTP